MNYCIEKTEFKVLFFFGVIQRGRNHLLCVGRRSAYCLGKCWHRVYFVSAGPKWHVLRRTQ